VTAPAEKLTGEWIRRRTRGARLRAWFIRSDAGPGTAWWRLCQWRRIGAVLLAFPIAGYVVAATGWFFVLRYGRQLESVRWPDVLVPSRWTHVHEAFGDRALVRAKKCIAEGKFPEALAHARAGLTWSPGNRACRLLDVQLEHAARQPARARRVLLDGLPYHHGDPDYVTAVMTFLLERQEDRLVVALAKKYFPRQPIAAPGARLFALAAATASCFRGEYDQAEDFLRLAPGLAGSRDGRLLTAKIEWDRGFRARALAQLRRIADESPHDAELHRELVMRLRQQKLGEEARRRTLAFQIAHPQLAAPRIELIEAYRDANEPDHVAREAEALLRDFSADRAALLGLAEFAANAGDVALADRVAHAAPATDDSFAFLAIEARLVARDYRGALDVVSRFVSAAPARSDRYRTLIPSLEAIANLGLGHAPEARVLVSEFLNQPNLRAENLLVLAERCLALDERKIAWQILTRATEVEPLNQAALTRLVEFEFEPGFGAALPAHLRQLLAMRRPSPDILRVAQRRLGSDFYLFNPEAKLALADIAALLEKSRGQ